MVEVSSKRSDRDLRVALLLVALLGSLVLGGIGRPPQPEGARIKSFSADRSTDQAGGHPDIERRIRSRHARRSRSFRTPAFATLVKDALVELPDRLHRQPRTRCHSARRHSSRWTNARSIPRSGSPNPSRSARRSKATRRLPEGRSTTWCRSRARPACRHSRRRSSTFPSTRCSAARTGSDYGLNAEVKGILQLISPLQDFEQTIWGVPASPVARSPRCELRTAGILGSWASTRTARKRRSSPTRPAASGRDSALSPSIAYDAASTRPTIPGRRRPAATSSTSTRPCRRKPTTEAADTASGLDIDPQGPAVRQSRHAARPRRSRARPSRFPEGFSINPNAADGKTSCSDAEARLRHRAKKPECPEYSKIGTSAIDSLGAAGADLRRDLSRRTEARRPLPDRSSPPTASAPTSSSPARPSPTRRPAS